MASRKTRPATATRTLESTTAIPTTVGSGQTPDVDSAVAKDAATQAALDNTAAQLADFDPIASREVSGNSDVARRDIALLFAKKCADGSMTQDHATDVILRCNVAYNAALAADPLMTGKKPRNTDRAKVVKVQKNAISALRQFGDPLIRDRAAQLVTDILKARAAVMESIEKLAATDSEAAKAAKAKVQSTYNVLPQCIGKVIKAGSDATIDSAWLANVITGSDESSDESDMDSIEKAKADFAEMIATVGKQIDRLETMVSGIADMKIRNVTAADPVMVLSVANAIKSWKATHKKYANRADMHLGAALLAEESAGSEGDENE